MDEQEVSSYADNITDEDKAKQLKKDIREKLKDYILDYPDRTICGCDGEVYNTLMNWAYKNQIANHLAFDRFVETFGEDLKDIKQRPESADRASRRYYKSQRKEGAKPDSQLSLFSDSKSTTLS